MKILITGICGFAGSELAFGLRNHLKAADLIGLDNLSRPGSHENRARLRTAGITVRHGDVRNPSDLENLPDIDWVIDAAANPSVLAGVAGGTTSRQVVEHNLLGTVNLLECCRKCNAGFILLSTSRVYSIKPLAGLPLEVEDNAFRPAAEAAAIPGISPDGIDESFDTTPPVSLYGSTKLTSELLALEYSAAFSFPVRINRCGVLAGAGQFGRPDQGIFSYWIHSWAQKQPLTMIGFGGTGHQVRDCLHPRDLVDLMARQMKAGAGGPEGRVCNLSGGIASAHSLAQLNAWCTQRFGPHAVQSEPADRPNDLPWVVLDHGRATREWDWRPKTSAESIFEEIACQAEARDDWLDLSAD